MTENIYKSLRIIDGRPKWVITDGSGKIIDKNPVKEQIKIAREERYKIYAELQKPQKIGLAAKIGIIIHAIRRIVRNIYVPIVGMKKIGNFLIVIII